MKLFLANAFDYDENYESTSTLHTFWDMNDRDKQMVKKHIEKWGQDNFILDSGAFSLFSGSVKNLDYNKLKKYIDDYCYYVKRNNIKNFIEMDIDMIIGYENVKKIREYITNKVGRKPIEVWHTWRGDEDLIRSCKENDFICIGIKKKLGMKDTFQHLIDIAYKYNTKVHILGWTPLNLTDVKRIYSSDSTTWLSGGRFGSVYQFKNNKMIMLKRPEGFKRIDDTEVYVNLHKYNLKQWIKYQQFLQDKGWNTKNK